MPHALELPRMLRAIVELMRGERLASRVRSVVDELVARGLRGTGRGRFSGRSPRLMPRLAAVIGALNDLPKPTAGLGGIKPVGIGWRSFYVIHLPSRKGRTAEVPLFSL